MRPLGRKTPPNFDHILKYPFSVDHRVSVVEKILKLPSWHWSHDQGKQGACVGHGTAMERAITNTAQTFIQRLTGTHTRRYDPIWIWNEAKLVDGDPNTNPGDDNGTYVHAAYDVMRDQGPLRCQNMKVVNEIATPIGDDKLPTIQDGAVVNRWATSVDDMRASIAQGIPVTIGVNWYENFDNPVLIDNQYFIGRSDLGAVRGGHCTCIYGASDRRQAFRLKNSWGKAYPLVWVPYNVMTRLLSEQGEATLVTDR